MTTQEDTRLARSNYKFNKRQKELARKKKKEEKRQRRQEKNDNSADGTFTREPSDRVENTEAPSLPAGPDVDDLQE